MTEKWLKVIKYLLIFFTISGYSFEPHSMSNRPTLTMGEDELHPQITEPEITTNTSSEETLSRNQEYVESTDEKQTLKIFSTSGIIKQDRKTEKSSPKDNLGKRVVKLKKPYLFERMKQEMMEEERKDKLVANIKLQEAKETTFVDENMQTARGQKEGNKISEAKRKDIKNANQKDGDNLTPPSGTLFNQPEILGTMQTTTQLQNPPSSRPSSVYQNVLSPPDDSTGHSGSKLKPKDVDVKSRPNSKDWKVRKVLEKPIESDIQIHPTELTRNLNTDKKGEFIPIFLKPTEAKFIVRNARKEPKPPLKLHENLNTSEMVILQPNMTQTPGKLRTVKQMDKDTKYTEEHDETSSQEPKVTKTSSKPQLTTPSTKPTKTNKRSKDRVIGKDKKGRKNNKTQKPPQEKKKNTPPMHFPYFKDKYCPPECACYGRVVQCSDKGVKQVPYGIPYNSRYILLMNNHITSIQLDLLSEYKSMEFLTLSNNQLTDGAIEGAFEGVPFLKRLYLDRNLLESVPIDLPDSLEELRLDNNHLKLMSQAAWRQCPGLLVLSLSNNSLGNKSESLLDDVLSPLYKLQTLNLNYNQLASVPLGLPLSIKELYLKGNHIKQFCGGTFIGVSELLVLDLSVNRLRNKGLSRESLLNATHLESLNLEGNQLKQVPRHLPLSLKTLNLEGNLITSIKKAAFSTLKNLEHLGLAGNKIFKVAPGAFKTLHVLHQLDLCNNSLQQVPRRLPPSLDTVILSNNNIQSVPRDAFCWGNKSQSLSRLVRVQLECNLIDMGKLNVQAFRCLRGFQVVHFY